MIASKYSAELDDWIENLLKNEFMRKHLFLWRLSHGMEFINAISNAYSCVNSIMFVPPKTCYDVYRNIGINLFCIIMDKWANGSYNTYNNIVINSMRY